MNWLKNRWNEPETRAAVATALGLVAAEITGKIDLHTMTLGLLTAALAFIFPSTTPPAA